jgi:hypothetical protein
MLLKTRMCAFKERTKSIQLLHTYHRFRDEFGIFMGFGGGFVKKNIYRAEARRIWILVEYRTGMEDQKTF